MHIRALTPANRGDKRRSNSIHFFQKTHMPSIPPSHAHQTLRKMSTSWCKIFHKTKEKSKPRDTHFLTSGKNLEAIKKKKKKKKLKLNLYATIIQREIEHHKCRRAPYFNAPLIFSYRQLNGTEADSSLFLVI
jgi:hypothetical protein